MPSLGSAGTKVNWGYLKAWAQDNNVPDDAPVVITTMTYDTIGYLNDMSEPSEPGGPFLLMIRRGRN